MPFIINGGKKLEGAIRLSGAKNAATKMMVASLLTAEEVTLENFPNIGDTHITGELCTMIGSNITIAGNTATLATPDIKTARVASLSRRNRIPILTMGPLLHRAGYAEIPFLGGDQIGPRPVNFHLDALRAMGAEITVKEDRYVASAPNGLHGTEVYLPYPSVGATENIMLAATRAKGKTVIRNAAKEPEVMDLIVMLTAMGADIQVAPNRVITVSGVPKLHGVRHTIMPDRNEAVSFACLAVANNGRIKVQDAHPDHLKAFLSALTKAGGGYNVEGDGIVFFRREPLKAVAVETETYPGFMTDWQQPFAVVLTQASGISTIHETVFQDRFAYAVDLNSMGADIRIVTKCMGSVSCRFRGEEHPHSAEIVGPTSLHGAPLKVRDLRSGITHVIAALIAEGESVIDGIEELDRGYEKIDERLRALGAAITRVESS